MAKVRTLQASFVSGEIGPTVQARSDTEIYLKAVQEARNVYVHPQGGLFRREGLQYVDTTASSAEGRLVPFEFNDVQTYMLVFTAGQFVVYKTDSNTVQATVSSSPVSSLTTDIIREMKFTQSADTLILVHKDIQPIKITRTSHTVWTATTITIENIPPYAFGSLTTANPSGSVQPDVKTGQVVLTGTTTTFTTDCAVGQFINMPKGGRIYITAINSNTEIEGDIVVELASTSSVASGDWEYESGYEDVISNTRGWARSVTFYKGRLIFGGLGSRPQTILMSKVGDFYNFDIGTGLDDEAIDITIDDDKVNIIHDVFSARGLQVFTTGGEYTIRSELNDALTPTSAVSQLYNETRHGSGNATSTVVRKPLPVSVDGSTVFVQREGAIVRQFVFSETEQSFNAANISILAPHLIVNPVAAAIRKAGDKHPADYVYLVNNDGTCAVLNSLREQDLLAWSLFTTDGEFEDVAVSGNVAYFIVQRLINGSTVRYVEKLNEDHFMDASTSQTTAPATTSWSNLDHLEAETVTVRGDDFVLDDEVVSSGAITSSQAVTTLEAGMPFYAKVKTLPIDVVVQGQSWAGQYKSPVFANLRLYDSRNIKVTYNGNDHYPVFREFGDAVLDDPITKFTGWKKVYVGGVNRDVEITITQDEPIEFNLLAIHYGVRI